MHITLTWKLSILLYAILVWNLSFYIPLSSKAYPFAYHPRLQPIILYIIPVWNWSFCIPFPSKTYPLVYYSRPKPILLCTTLSKTYTFCIPISSKTYPFEYQSRLKLILSYNIQMMLILPWILNWHQRILILLEYRCVLQWGSINTIQIILSSQFQCINYNASEFPQTRKWSGTNVVK